MQVARGRRFGCRVRERSCLRFERWGFPPMFRNRPLDQRPSRHAGKTWPKLPIARPSFGRGRHRAVSRNRPVAWLSSMPCDPRYKSQSTESGRRLAHGALHSRRDAIRRSHGAAGMAVRSDRGRPGGLRLPSRVWFSPRVLNGADCTNACPASSLLDTGDCWAHGGQTHECSAFVAAPRPFSSCTFLAARRTA